MKTILLLGVLGVGFALAGIQQVEDVANPQPIVEIDDLQLDSVQDSLTTIENRLETHSDMLESHSKELQAISECMNKEIAGVKQQLVSTSVQEDSELQAKLQAKLTDLEIRVAKLEVDAAKVSAPARYPAATSASGSNGSTGGGGSTGIPSTSSVTTVTSSQSYGSTGSAPMTYSYPAAPVQQRATPVRNAVANVVDNYRARWTFPGAIDHHLQTAHGQNVNGLSQAEMLRLHDSLHENSTVRTFPQAASDCPGGVCPTGSNGVQYGVMQKRSLLFPNLRRR